MYADVVFPLKLPPLTYRVPSYLLSEYKENLKGRVVKAPLMNKNHYGLVIKVMDESEIPEKKNVKEIQSVHQHFAAEPTISLLKWLSDYYLTPMGIALKSSFFEEAIKAAVSSQQLAVRTKNNEQKIKAENSELSLVYDCIKEKKYKTFLYHAPPIFHETYISNIDTKGNENVIPAKLVPAGLKQGAVIQRIRELDSRLHGNDGLEVFSGEYSLLNDLLNKSRSDIHGAIILVPEIGDIERLLPILKDIFDERVCIIHSKLTKAKRADVVRKIISGESDIVIGTRSAVLSPLQNISFIAVLSEHSPSYKGQEGLRYNARDVAVMRGFMDKSCVLLSSVCPSVESIYNVKIGKYTTLVSSQQSVVSGQQTDLKRPKIKIVDIKKEKTSTISRDILKEAKVTTSKNERLLFLVNRKGYSLIKCEDCDNIVRCRKCQAPLVFYKDNGKLRCHYCGYEKAISESCNECKGFNIKLFGTGTERIKEEMEILTNFTPFVIGTAYATRKLRDEKFDAVALFNIDGLLAQPDFRAYERAFQEVVQVAQMVKADGSILLQTWNPKNRALRFIKNYDFEGFYTYELSQRKAFNLPPFSKVILFNIFTKKDVQKFLKDIQSIIGDTTIDGVELLGPVEMPSASKSHKHCIQMLLKSKDRKLIHATAKDLLSKFEKLKGIKINVDVDPLKI